MASRVRVRSNLRGVRKVLKSPGVASMLGRQAERAAKRCNALCPGRQGRAGAEPYGSKVVQRGYTAGGLVFTATKLGVRDNLDNNTLKKGCGV